MFESWQSERSELNKYSECAEQTDCGGSRFWSAETPRSRLHPENNCVCPPLYQDKWLIHDGSQHAYKSSIDCLESPEKTYVLIVTAAFSPQYKCSMFYSPATIYCKKGAGWLIVTGINSVTRHHQISGCCQVVNIKYHIKNWICFTTSRGPNSEEHNTQPYSSCLYL